MRQDIYCIISEIFYGCLGYHYSGDNRRLSILILMFLMEWISLLT